jgi:formate dehydrogenase subunit gamma
MARNSNRGRPRAGGIRKMWLMVGVALLALVLPLGLGLLHGTIPTAEAAFQGGENPRADYWGAVRRGVEGYTSVKGQETNVLIENGGQIWREFRNGPLATFGAWLLGVALLLVVLFHLVGGRARLENRTGRKISRWSAWERTMHWFVAILFIVLAITGLSLLYGRAVLIPVFGLEGFAAYAQLAKDAHNYLSLFFVVGLLAMIVSWAHENVFKKADWEWFKAGGGYLGGKHPPAYKVNAGEKIWFWMLTIFGIVMMASGAVLLFPNLGFERGIMQLATIVHAASSILLIGLSFGHVYLGTLGNEGSFEGMITGEVDEGWAKQHHNLWYEEVAAGGGERPRAAQATDRPRTA